MDGSASTDDIDTVALSEPAATTVNAAALMPVRPSTVTDMGPLVAPVGTMATNCVALACITKAGRPLNATLLLATLDTLNAWPVIVTDMPATPRIGENPETIGDGYGDVTVKFVALVPMRPSTDTLIGPVVAQVGNVAISRVVVADVRFAWMPLKVTIFPDVDAT